MNGSFMAFKLTPPLCWMVLGFCSFWLCGMPSSSREIAARSMKMLLSAVVKTPSTVTGVGGTANL